MKKLLPIVFLFAVTISQAQMKPFEFGFLFNTNATTFISEPSLGTAKPMFGMGASVFGRMKILFLYAELDAGYASHAVNVTQTASGLAFSSDYKLNGIDISGILGWRVIGIGPLGNFRLFAGYNINNFSKITVETNGTSVSNPSINTGNSSFVLGTGVDLWRIVFNLKYHIGTSDLSTLATQEIKAASFLASIGIKF